MNFERVHIDFSHTRIDVHNYYLRDQGNYYRRPPRWHEGRSWEPPLFNPITFIAGVTVVLAMEELFGPKYCPNGLKGINYPISSMAGANVWAGNLAALWPPIRDSYHLLEAGRFPQDRYRLAARAGIPYDELRRAVGQADLMRIYGIGPRNSRLLVDAGIESVQDLARYNYDPQLLYDQLRYSASWDWQYAPSLNEVESWISQARNLPVAVYDDGSQRPNVPSTPVYPPPYEPPYIPEPPGPQPPYVPPYFPPFGDYPGF